LIHNKALHFSKPDKLGDEFEGYYSKPPLRGITRIIEHQFVPFLEEELRPEDDRLLRQWNIRLRDYVFINCWHINNRESHGLWQLYSSQEGVVIKSTFTRLKDSFKNASENIFIGPVTYIDWEDDPIPPGNALFPFVHKRKYFESERELRALTSFDPFPENYRESGLNINVDLQTLIETVYLSPKAPKWIYDLVVAISAKYGLEIEIKMSKLSEKPI